MKLDLWCYDYIVISQANHGKGQNGLAFDFAHLSGPSPVEGKILGIYPQKDNKLSWFKLGKDNWFLEFVHSRPVKAVNSWFKVGEKLWDTTWHHLHFTVWIDGKPGPGTAIDYLNRKYFDRIYWLKKGQKHPVWTNPSTYTDRHLPPYPTDVVYDMALLQKPIKCVTTNTVAMRVRKDPNTTSAVLETVDSRTQFDTREISGGSEVNGNKTWYKYKQGWVSGAFIEEIGSGNSSELEKQLRELNEKNSELINKVSERDEQVNQLNLRLEETLGDNMELNEIVEALKLVNSIQ